MIHIAVLGHGVVGSGVCEVLEQNAEGIAKKAGCKILVKRILDQRDFPDSPYREKFTTEYAQILSDPQIRIVVEAMGGTHPAYEYVREALLSGRSVVTSNKELVAGKGAELLRIARDQGVNFLFEASVGGGIPIIRPLHQCLAANTIDEIAGILNGTTNFILTKMKRENMQFADALQQAQDLGYAEADPTADIEGLDTCRKICILASLAFGSHVYPEQVHTQGITAITAEDMQYADSAGCAIKLIGSTRRLEDGTVYALVSPALLDLESQLAGVDDVFNGILVRGDATGDVVFYGKGAGKLPTASAVVGDVIDCAKASGHIDSLYWSDSEQDNIAPYKEYPCAFYLRFSGGEAAGLTAVFSGAELLTRKGQPQDEHALITAPLSELDMQRRVQELETKGYTLLSSIRKLDY